MCNPTIHYRSVTPNKANKDFVSYKVKKACLKLVKMLSGFCPRFSKSHGKPTFGLTCFLIHEGKWILFFFAFTGNRI